MDVKYRRALGTLIVISAERLKSLFLHEKFLGTHFVRTMHVLNKVINSIHTPIITLECATHGYCSQLFHSCLQRYIGSCRGDKLRDG